VYFGTRKGQPNLRVIANIGFDTKSLYIECMSENRLDRSKKIHNYTDNLINFALVDCMWITKNY
jgi:hypothetical protein